MTTWRSGIRRRLGCGSAALLTLALLGGEARAQRGTTVHVRDDQGRGVPFAVVSWGSASTAIADTSGRVIVPGVRGDSVRLRIRRLGHRPFDGFVRPAGDSAVEVILPAIARQLTTVEVTARSTPLARTGFYDRVDRVRKGAIIGEFITPEELDERDQMKVSNVLRGSRHARIGVVSMNTRQRIVVLGRGGCAMTIVVDGQRVANTAEKFVKEQAPGSIMNAKEPSGGGDGLVLDIDELVSGREVMAIEIYPSTANAPAELIAIGGRGSCGFVAIWTGPRQ